MKTALLSVSDKTGLIDFARVLQRRGIALIASGGTAHALTEAGLPVRTVEALTGFPEMLGGRVKTLHPAIHAGILARRTPEQLAELSAGGFAPIDLVVVNLYPFQATVARPDVTLGDAVEQVDIGGVALLRAAAKNFEWVTVICDSTDYAALAVEIERDGDSTRATRLRLAQKAFQHTASYDAAITEYLSRIVGAEEFPRTWTLTLEKAQDLRYGENPHQRAALYREVQQVGLADARILQGKALSYTNWLDAEAAWRAANDFDDVTAVIIKHTTPCGMASAETLARAYREARACDPLSAFGGVVGVNRGVDAETARALSEIFTEVVIAPRFDAAAREILSAKKDLRLLEFAPTRAAGWQLRGIAGSYLVQEDDRADASAWRVVSARAPSDAEARALRFAWRAVKHVKSNAIVLARETRSVGMGAGQMSRVDAVRIAVQKADGRAQGAVLASDAFFPFPDGVEEACRAGVTAIVQPGGSLRDADVLDAANRFGAAMIFTGTRHFRH